MSTWSLLSSRVYIRCQVLIAMAIGGVVGGCRHATPPTATEGRSSFRFAAPLAMAGMNGASISAVRASDEEVVPAEPIEPLAKPVYPPALLSRRGMPVMIRMRATVDVTGRVAELVPSFPPMTTAGEYQQEFEAAVAAAVEQWRFRPAEILKVDRKSGPNGKPFLLIRSKQLTDSSFDVVFTFTATGEVLAGWSEPAK